MSKLRVAVIGCGSIAKYRHIPEYSSNDKVELVAFVDPVLERAESFAATYGGKAYIDYKEMLEQIKPDAVSVCSPNWLHAQMTIDAANCGAHVLVEKPMAATDEEAEEMIHAAKANNVKLMVGHNQRFFPIHIKSKEILNSGILGKVLTFRTSFGHPGPDSWSADGENSWFFHKDKAMMGAMGDLGVHKADLIRWLLQDEVTQVSAFIATLHKDGNVDDNASCLLRMKSGAIGTLVASWTYYRGEDNSTILWCENGVMKIGMDSPDKIVLELRDGTVQHFETGAMSTNEKQMTSGIIDHFVESIVNNTTPSITGEEGRASLKVILDAFKSQETGQTITVNE